MDWQTMTKRAAAILIGLILWDLIKWFYREVRNLPDVDLTGYIS